MLTFVARRLLATVPLLFGITLVVFFLVRLIPGDPVNIYLAGAGVRDDALKERLRREYGLDQPIPVQYGVWLQKLAHGDLGRSLTQNRPVAEVLATRLANTAWVALAAVALVAVLAVGVGVPSAVLSAQGRYPLLDRVSALAPLLLLTIPSFSLGLALIYVFAVRLQWLPAAGMRSPTGGDFWDLLRHLVLPAVTLAAASIGANIRLARSSVLETLREDYVRTAYAKGLHERTIFYAHALRNALVPLVTSVGLLLGSLLTGAVIVETLFNWPGIGQMLVQGILSRDYPLVQGGTLLVATVYVVTNLLADVLYAVVDPRIRYGRGG